MVFFLLRRRPCLRSLDFYFFIVSSNFCFMKIFFVWSKIQKSNKILHSKMKAGANLALTQRFSNSNGIGLRCVFLNTLYLSIINQAHLTISITIFLNVCLCFLVRFTNISQSGFWRSLKATARWWFSRTDSSLYMMASSELVLIKNWLVRPGWSTSWMAAANIADITSSGVNTHWQKKCYIWI